MFSVDTDLIVFTKCQY